MRMNQVVVLLILLDKLHSTLLTVIFNVEMDGFEVADESFFSDETDGAHVAFVNISTEVLLAVVALEDIPLIEGLLAKIAPETLLKYVHGP